MLAERDALAQEGAVVVPGLLDAGWRRRALDAIERCRAAPGPHYGVLSPPGSPRVDSDLFRWHDDEDLFALTHESPLVPTAMDLLGGDEVVLVEDQWFASEAGATTPSPWHQDQPYYRVDRPFLTLWVTLDDIDDGACLRVVPGSHATGVTYAPVEFSATGTTVAGGSGFAPVPDVGPDEERSWTLRAGDAIALDSRVLHATGRRALGAPFRRLSTRWATAGTRYRDGVPGTAAFWDVVPHGLRDGDRLASAAFPVLTR